MDRSQACKLLAKIFAYLACGKRETARQYAEQLIKSLQPLLTLPTAEDDVNEDCY